MKTKHKKIINKSKNSGKSTKNLYIYISKSPNKIQQILFSSALKLLFIGNFWFCMKNEKKSICFILDI